MKVWRLCRQRHAATALSGEGARIAGGRWNHRGVSVAYCASSLSLATLEMFVHVDPSTSPDDLVAIEVDLPLDPEHLEETLLPKDWRAVPAPDALKDIGSDWAKSNRSLALSVPSAIIRQERNILINPLHPDLQHVKILETHPFSFDPRMWKTP